MSNMYVANAQQTIVKSPIDAKQYRYLELNNRLKVLLVSDSETDKAAAALDVYVGSGSDPEGWQGLAHFLEHMLFLGTKKYPTADEYQAFIKNNGGSHNAFTSFAHTNYYLSIAADQLKPALDRFSRFFIDPTFNATYVDRERSIIDAEYQSRKKNEQRRLWDVQKQWLNQAHPSANFTVGSLHSLRDRDVSARETLVRFYKQHYSANIMALVVLGRESLDQLENMVTERFSQIPDRDLVEQLFAQQYMDPTLMPARLNSLPERELDVVSFVFPIPSTEDEYASKPLGYIANLLGHEGQGSLYALLKERGWAEHLSVGLGYMDRVQGEFKIQIYLTKQGLNHIDDIGELVFQAINLIKQQDIDEWRFWEQNKLSAIAFRFQQEGNPGRLVQSLASRLQRYPAKDVLRGAYLMDKFAPARIKMLLDYLNPNNVNLHVTSQTLPTDQISEYYDVKYSLAAIKPEILKRWQTKATHDNLTLPTENPFIPERLDLLKIDSAQNRPQRISSVQTGLKPSVAIWYQPDNEFETPRANFYFTIRSPLVNSSVENWVLTSLYVRLVNSQLTKTIYPAYLADLNYRLYRHVRGISVQISGFEDRQSQLLELIIDGLANPDYDEQRFEIIKNGLLRSLGNVAKDPPLEQAVYEIYQLLTQPYWTDQEQIAVLNDIGVEDLANFMPKLFEQVDVSVLSHGDVSVENTLARSAMLDRLLKDSQFINHVAKPTIRKLERAKRYLSSLDVAHSDTALVAYFQGNNNTITERAKTVLLGHLLKPYFYNQLRTVNHVGYLVYASTLEIDQTPGLRFAVQSASHSPAEINRLYDTFRADFDNTLHDMSEQQFESLKAALVTKMISKDKNLTTRSQRYWREIDDEEYQFDSQQQFADAVARLTLKEVQHYYKDNIINHPTELLVQSLGSGNDSTGRIQPQGYVETMDAVRFRQSHVPWAESATN